MDLCVEHPTRPHQRRVRRLRRGGPLALGLVAVGLLVSACGSGGSSVPGVAHVLSTPSAGSSSPGGSSKPSPLGYALCMRSHGIADFPEPNAGGSVSLQQGQQLPDVNSPEFKAAAQACKSLNPAGAAPAPGQQAQQLAAEVKYAQCMRSHGIANFPDPTSAGGLDFSSVDVNAPQVIAADKACATEGIGMTQSSTT